MPTNNPIFKSAELEKQFYELYEAVLDMWPKPVDQLDVSTSYGITHVNACGNPGSPPMVLLPGFGANSTMWFPNVASLCASHHIYAVDTPGQPGRSIPGQKLTASNSAEWLTEVFDALRLEKACLAGVSLGGWLALDFSIHHPNRVNRLVLLDPAASLEGVSPAFMWHSFLPIMVHPTRDGLIRYFRWMTRGYQVNKQWGEMMILGILNTHPQPPIRPKPFSDEELLQLSVPTLLLIGGQSVIYNPKRAYQRAIRLIPNLTADIIQDASHSLNAEKADIVNDRMLQFCMTDQPGVYV
jgi:pimeloyl-ACP methyl ester carboxylesterase